MRQHDLNYLLNKIKLEVSKSFFPQNVQLQNYFTNSYLFQKKNSNSHDKIRIIKYISRNPRREKKKWSTLLDSG